MNVILLPKYTDGFFLKIFHHRIPKSFWSQVAPYLQSKVLNSKLTNLKWSTSQCQTSSSKLPTPTIMLLGRLTFNSGDNLKLLGILFMVTTSCLLYELNKVVLSTNGRWMITSHHPLPQNHQWAQSFWSLATVHPRFSYNYEENHT